MIKEMQPQKIKPNKKIGFMMVVLDHFFSQSISHVPCSSDYGIQTT